jgi:hypothetical protein
MDTTPLKECAEDLSHRLNPRIEEAKQQIGRLNNQIAGFIRNNPTACLLGALALGYFVAHIARRRHSQA